MTQKIVLASGNAKKVAELQSLLGELGMSVVPQTELGVTDAEPEQEPPARPPNTPEDFIGALERIGLPEAAAALRELFAAG